MTYSPAAPVFDAQGRPVWNIFATLPGSPEVHVATDNVGRCVAIATFLDEHGYAVLTDAIVEHRTDEQAEAAYNEGYEADNRDDEAGLLEADWADLTEDEQALVLATYAHWNRMAHDTDYKQGVKDAQRDAASYEHEQAWLQGQRYQ